MSLSEDLISQFVKATKDTDTSKSEGTTVYGTIVKQGDSDFVKLDGAERLTPVTSTSSIEDGDRVTVMIKNHTAIVTGNISSPSASNNKVTEISGKVDNVIDQISEFEIVVADKVSTKEFDTEKARIDDLVADNVTIKENLKATDAEIDDLQADNVTIKDQLTAQNANIENLNAKMLTADAADLKYATIDNLNVTNQTVNNLSATYGEFKQATVERLNADEADIKKLQTDKLNAADAEIMYATISNLDATNAEIDILQADHGEFKTLATEKFTAHEANISKLQTDKLDVTTANAKFANIDFSNIGEAAITKLFSDSGIIKDLVVSEGKITGELVGVTIKGDLIEGGTVIADKLVIKGDNGLFYKLNVNSLGEATASSDEKYKNQLDGSVIVAKSITAEKVSVKDLVAFDATIGGFNITDSALYSGVKASVDNTTSGVYLDKTGQMVIGNGTSFAKFYKDQNGNFKLDISADSIKFGSDKQSVETVIGGINKEVGDIQTAVETAQSAADAAQKVADQAKTNAATAQSTADAAKTAASDAATKADDAQTVANAAKTAASDAQEIADTAKANADAAQADADAATLVANNAQTAANSAQATATNAKTAADKANEAAANAQKAAEDADARVTTTANDLATAKENLASVTSRVDATEEEIAAAQEAVETAQVAADNAKLDAANAQKAADTAKANAATAQTKANEAATAAATAQSTANTAKTNAANAQSTADTAKANAATAQSTADTAKANAATAQSTADTAKTNAANAQKAADQAQVDADAAQKAADKAQADVDVIAIRVSSAETKIEQNQNAIALSATKTEVTETLKGYYTKEQADAALTVKANEITSNVSSTYATKTALNTTNSNVSKAQSTADAAKNAANAAQTDVDKLETRVTTAETSISQNKDAIALRATKTEVSTAKSEAISTAASDATTKANKALSDAKSYADAQIKVSADSITSTVSSTYATKTALNTTNSNVSKAQSTADAVKRDITSLIEGNLIPNGYGIEKNNSNFEHWTYSGDDKCDGFPSFNYWGTGCDRYIPSTMIPINIMRQYTFNMSIKAGVNIDEKIYLGWDEFDIDGKRIEAHHCYAFEPSTTTLIKDLNNGDTVVYLTDASGWTSTTYTHQLGLIFWNYKDSAGYKYPIGTYSRNSWLDLYTNDNVNKTNNTITLKSPWTHGKISAGTSVSQSNSAGHKYFNYTNTTVPTTWTETEWVIEGVQDSYTWHSKKINPATKYIRFIVLHNYLNSSTKATTYISKVSLKDTTDESIAKAAQEFADSADAKAESAESIATTAQSQIEQLAKSISTLVTDGNGASLMTQTEEGWTFNIGAIQSQLNNATNDITTSNGNIDANKGEIAALQNALSSLNDVSGYLVIKIIDDQPCLELGKQDSDFKVRITNTDIKFMDGASVPAYISNQALNIGKAVINDEMQLGGFVWSARSNGNLGLQWKG